MGATDSAADDGKGAASMANNSKESMRFMLVKRYAEGEWRVMKDSWRRSGNCIIINYSLVTLHIKHAPLEKPAGCLYNAALPDFFGFFSGDRPGLSIDVFDVIPTLKTSPQKNFKKFPCGI
jgi:hypothetical protein